MEWSIVAGRPVYLQLIEQLELAIVVGEYPPGEKIPGVRDLAAQAQVNPNTMQRALAELERDGLLYSQRTAGRFVTDQSDRITQKRKELAMQQIRIFLSSMKEMGYTSEQTLNLIQQAVKEEHS